MKTRENLLYSKGVPVSYTLKKNKIVKLYFFEYSNALAVTVKGQQYQDMLAGLMVQATNEMNVNHFFQKDGRTTWPNIELLQVKLQVIFYHNLTTVIGNVVPFPYEIFEWKSLPQRANKNRSNEGRPSMRRWTDHTRTQKQSKEQPTLSC